MTWHLTYSSEAIDTNLTRTICHRVLKRGYVIRILNGSSMAVAYGRADPS